MISASRADSERKAPCTVAGKTARWLRRRRRSCYRRVRRSAGGSFASEAHRRVGVGAQAEGIAIPARDLIAGWLGNGVAIHLAQGGHQSADNLIVAQRFVFRPGRSRAEGE